MWDEGYPYWWELSEVVSFDRPILVSLGDASTTAVRPAEVFGAALKVDAKAIVVAHDHPSGNMTPSAQDRELTAALKRLGEALGVTVLDHLIITGENHEYKII